MIKSTMALFGASLLLASLTTAAFGQKLPPRKPVPYRLVASLLKVECESCHNAKKHPEKVDLSSYAAVMASGEKGPIVVPGNPKKSKLLLYVNGAKQPRMPFKSKPLGTGEIDLISRWIATGAKGK